ncbi:uncharacterized protein LOC113352346 [Papaver somniferum]|uniref:uncharacterized protein LOC113352346 n=1 Tax=Papaver somniferum TaxID=3469 RepID=UPI000E6FB125|nr:uncharacterized protein LOC113352346 [Papaver somniferum]
MSPYVPIGRGRHNLQEETNLQHYQIGLFNNVIDMQIAALNDRFDELNTELLLCMSHLNPSQKFSSYDKGALIRLAKLYPSDFSEIDLIILIILERQLDTFLADVLSSNDFSELVGISGLAQKMVDTKRNQVYPLVYLLITLSPILSVATTTVERVFSALDIVKNRLRNRMGNELLNNCSLTYIERDVLRSISNERIIKRFRGMATRRG